MEEILQNVESPYLTTEFLLSLYSGHKAARDKLKNLVRSGDLLHIKQGLYLPGEKYKRPYSKEVLSGMIYGPSAISFEYALSYHGMIPERVETVTCICFKRDKNFTTPVGTFHYKYLAKELYPVGLKFHQTELGNFFMASKEKALCDLAYLQKFKDEKAALEFLHQDLRIEESDLLELDTGLLFELSKVYQRASTRALLDALLALNTRKS
ncbi:MAG: hypothetical protein A2X86_11870 [Bdellovibrionales bacterium GWA2_49_15]|nr:MAG: hypothetical protein A2X86_11870 [Bdellovibrionales bacterium GWA2_49_15]HAZ12551.1 hypothetical protein [Bdellovibrionales bacterium]